MTRFFTMIHGETGISMSMTTMEGSLAYAKARHREVVQRLGDHLIYIHLLESVKTDRGTMFVEHK